MNNRRGTFILLFPVFAINFLSLVYQVVWVRKIMVIFGTTALFISTILTVFLAGIALGGYLGGILIRRVEHKYRVCGLPLLFSAFSVGAEDGIIRNIDDLPYLEFKTAQNIFLKAGPAQACYEDEGQGALRCSKA